MDVPQSVIRNQLAYYDQYISDEIAKGRSEREVVDELGDPRLIAKTIEEATEAAGAGAYTDADYQETGRRSSYGDRPQGSARGGNYGSGYNSGEEPSGSGGLFSSGRGTSFQTSGTMGCLLLTVILIAVICLVGTILGALAPILTPIVVILVILWLLKGMMNK